MDGRAFGEGCCSSRCDGLLIEVHNNPEAALCDGAQSLRPERFARLMGELKGIARIVGRDM